MVYRSDKKKSYFTMALATVITSRRIAVFDGLDNREAPLLILFHLVLVLAPQVALQCPTQHQDGRAPTPRQSGSGDLHTERGAGCAR